MTGLRAKEAQCFFSVIASPAFYGFSSGNRYEQDVSDDVAQVRPASQRAFVSKLPSSFGADNGLVPSGYSVYCILDSLRPVCQSIIPRLPYAMDVSLKC